MRTMSRVLLGLLLTAALVGAMSAPALAGLPNGTTSGETTANALEPSGGTLPLSPGALSVRYTATTSSDSLYADTTGNVVTTVDTGFDMSQIVSPSQAPDTIAPGDSVTYTMGVRNLGNNAQDVPFNFNQIADTGVKSSFTWELFAEDTSGLAADAATGFDSAYETRISDTSPSIPMAENERDTLYAVISAKSSANDGDTIENRLFATDNAPIGGPNTGSNEGSDVGDEWQDSAPVSTSVDERDTQYVWYRTNISGPDLSITKVIDSDSSSGSYRPGDTVGYRITVTNNGGDTADNVEIVDAMPDSTTYVAGSAMIDTGTPDTSRFSGDGIGFENDLGSNQFDDSDATAAEKINWAIDEVGPSDQTNNKASVKFQVTID